MISREELYELVWSTPMMKVAEKSSVSGSYMARVCSLLNVPRPERGYWAKRDVGKAPERPGLPPPLPGDPLFWSQGGELPAPRLRAVTATSASPQPRIRRTVNGIHELIHGAKQHYETGYKVEKGQLLRPYKRKLVDVIASASGLDKALAFANDLFNALESNGHHVRLVSSSQLSHRPNLDERESMPVLSSRDRSYINRNLWWPASRTLVYVGAIPFGLAILEMTEAIEMRYVKGEYIRESEYRPPKQSRGYSEHTWTTTKNLPCGRLRLVVYTPQRDVPWSLSFQETVRRTLKQDIPKIVQSIESSVDAVRNEIDEAEQRAEAQRREWEEQTAGWKREEEQKRIADSIKESRDQLSQVIQSWAAVMSLEQFFKSVEARAMTLPEEEQLRVIERLQLAREFVGTQDPMEFFRSWKTPDERYVPLAKRPSRAEET